MAHALFHAANICLFISYLIPSVLALRCLLVTASIFFVAWGSDVLGNDVPTIVYNSVFIVINLAYAIRIVMDMRHVPLEPIYERLYEHFCSHGSLRLSRTAFHSLITAKGVTQRTLAPGEAFAQPGQQSTSLNILLCGRMAVYERAANGSNVFLHSLCEFDLIDSPEFVQHMANHAQQSSPQQPSNGAPATPALPSKVAAPTYHVLIEAWNGGDASGAELPPSPSAATLALLRPHAKAPPTVLPATSTTTGTVAGSTVLSIPYEQLNALTATNPQLGAVIDALVSVDVTSKLRWLSLRLADMVRFTPAQQAGIVSKSASASLLHVPAQPSPGAPTDSSAALSPSNSVPVTSFRIDVRAE